MSDYLVTLYNPSQEEAANTTIVTIPFSEFAEELKALWPNLDMINGQDFVDWEASDNNPGGKTIGNKKIHVYDGTEDEIFGVLRILRRIIPNEQDIYIFHMSMSKKDAIKITSNTTFKEFIDYLP